MPTSIEKSEIGDPRAKAAFEDVVREVMSRLSGDWRISILGSEMNDDVWELKIRGPKTSLRYNLSGKDGQHEPQFVRDFLEDRFASLLATPGSPSVPVADIWARLSNGGGTKADVQKVLHFIAENWFKRSEDLSVAQKWGRLSSADVARLKADLDKEDRSHIQDFEKLIWGISRGTLAPEFFTSLAGLTASLKQIAFVRGFRSASDENRVPILCALSQEAPNFIETCVAGFPRDPLVEVFRRYMQSSSNALKLQNQGLPDMSDASHIDLLFGITSLQVPHQNRYIGELAADIRGSLWGTAERLVRELPTEYFGRFARLRLSVFVWLAAAQREDAEGAKRLLLESADPIAVEVLQLSDGTEPLIEAFEHLTTLEGEERPAYSAALTDALRKNASAVLSASAAKLGAWSKSTSPILSVSAQAALLEARRVQGKDFQKVFLKAARSEKREALASWLADNPDFVKRIDFAKLPRAPWRSLLSSLLPIDSQLARLLIEAKTEIPESERYWQDSIEVLAASNTPGRESILMELIRSEVNRRLPPHSRDVLKNEPVRSLIQRRFWTLANSGDDQQKLRLLDAVRTKLSHADALQIVQSGLENQNRDVSESRSWMMRVLIPVFLKGGTLSPSFGQGLNDTSLKEALACQLSASTVTDWQYLTEFPEEWRSVRASTKSELFSRLRGGVQAALLNTRKDSPLYSGIERLYGALNEWREKESPPLDPSLNLAKSFESPRGLKEDKSVLEEYFHRQPTHPHELALFLGANPWSFQYLFHERGTWPKYDLIFESICKSYAFVAALRSRAAEQINGIRQYVLLDLAIAIRSILSDIETELAGYFFFKDVLAEIGVDAVTSRLGGVVKGSESGEEYRIVREAGRPGRLRIFSTGIKVADKILDSATAMQSGAEDDRD